MPRTFRFPEGVGPEGHPNTTDYAARCKDLEHINAKLLKALERLVRRSENGDIIEPGWYEIIHARETIDEVKGE